MSFLLFRVIGTFWFMSHKLVTVHEFLSTHLTGEWSISGMHSHVGPQVPNVSVAVCAMSTVMWFPM